MCYLQARSIRKGMTRSQHSLSLYLPPTPSLYLPLTPSLSLSVRQAGRGATAQELNNNFQQSSQEAGGPDCGCSLLLLSLPPLDPTLLPSTPLLLACVCSTGLMHSADRPALLKRHRPHFSPLNPCSGCTHELRAEAIVPSLSLEDRFFSFL